MATAQVPIVGFFFYNLVARKFAFSKSSKNCQNMPYCPRCNQLIDSQAITCPHCKNTLKAFGHPGIPLYQAQANTFLCGRCTYHHDDSCNYPQRPYAKTCTLFRDITIASEEETAIDNRSFKSKIIGWCRTNQFLLGILLLLSFSIILTIIR